MSRHHRQHHPLRGSVTRLLGTAVLGMSLAAGAAPAQASEVVKLARLLITGKRQPSKPPAAPQPSPTDRGGSTDAPGPQSRYADPELPVQQAQVTTDRRGAPEATSTMSMAD